MPEYRYVYPLPSEEDRFSFELCVREPRATYNVGQPAPEICRRLGRNIRHLRTRRRWSQEALALEAGLNRSMLGAIERAEVNTSIGTVEKIADVLERSVAELLSDKPLYYFDD